MNVLKLKKAVLLLIIPFLSVSLFAQQQLQQLIIVSGGAFSNPDDHVSISSFNTTNGNTIDFGEINTQAVQYAIIDGNFLYVTALDSLVKFDLNSNQKVASIAVSGPRIMLIHNDMLFVSIQYPETENFVRIYNKNTLDFIKSVQEVSGETAGLCIKNNKLYVAVPGDWTSTIGKIAVIDALTGDFIEEINLNNNGAGINDLYFFNNQLVSVQKSAWGSSVGFISFIDLDSFVIEHIEFPYSFGKGIHLQGQQLYLMLNNGVGSIDLNTKLVSNVSIIPDPGSANFIYLADAVFDPFSQQFFTSTTDYFSFGAGQIFNLEGVQTGSYTAGISAEALVLDYQTVSQVTDNIQNHLVVYPNPLNTSLFVENADQLNEIVVYNVSGQIVYSELFSIEKKTREINLSNFPFGVYYLIGIQKDGTKISSKIIKN